MRSKSGHDNLKRRLNGWQIFFIAIGGIIGVGFFRDSSTTLALAGPLGSLIAVVVVGIVAVAVMEGICEMIIIWPIPNAMVKFVNAFVDEDLGLAVGLMYWYLYCTSFSLLTITAGDLAEFWLPPASEEPLYIYKALIYVFVPILLAVINCAPVWLFGWVELIGGVIKIGLVFGTIILMFCINAGVGYGSEIQMKYFTDGIQNNPEAASNHFEAVLASIPLAIYAYIGVELLTTTAFEASDPEEMRLPASNVGWFSLILYGLSTGSFVANVSWQDQQLPKLFNQALVTISGDRTALEAFHNMEPPWPDTHAAPLIALYRNSWRTAPSILNGFLIYSAISCANTALYVASRQLYGLTRSIEITSKSSIPTRFLASMSKVHPKWHTPVFAIFISILTLVWLPFIKLKSDSDFLADAVSSLSNIGSVSAILMWCSQCVAYIMFSRWRDKHEDSLRELTPRWDKLFDNKKAGHFKVFQPWLAYLGAICTILIVFFLNTIPMWNGRELTVKAISTFVSPVIVIGIWLFKKLFFPHDSRKFFLNLSHWDDFESRLLHLDDLIYPVVRKKKSGGTLNQGAQPTPNQQDPEMSGAVSGLAANGILRDESVPNRYNRPDLETAGQGYGNGYAAVNGDVSPIDADDGGNANQNANPTSNPPMAQSHFRTQYSALFPPNSPTANSTSSTTTTPHPIRTYLSPLSRYPPQSVSRSSSHDASASSPEIDAEGSGSLVSSTGSHAPLRTRPSLSPRASGTTSFTPTSTEQQQPPRPAEPGSQWFASGYGYGRGGRNGNWGLRGSGGGYQ